MCSSDLSDSTNSRIRRITPDGVITTIAGNGSFAYAGDGGVATNAGLSFPTALLIDASGVVYFADSQNQVIRKLTPTTTSSAFPSIAGVAQAGAYGGGSTTAPGSWIEIFGTGLATTTRSWATSD